MKSFLLLFLFTLYLQAAGFWTLSGVDKANIYVNNQLSTLKPSTIKTMKAKMEAMLKRNGIQTKMQDSPTLMFKLEEIEGEENHYVYVKLALGEEVQTFRKNRDNTFALTYDANDFIDVESDELDEQVLESVDFLLEQFTELYEDDNE